MKKIIKEFWILAILLSVAFSGYAYDFSVDGIYYTKNSDGKTVYVTYGSIDYSGSVVIQSTVTYSGTTYSVTSIGSSAFAHCSGLTSVTIPNSVTSIGGSAFSGCSGLTSVTIGNSVTSIGGSAFSGCYKLASVSFGNSVTSIGVDAFYGTAWYNNQPDGLVYAGKVAYKYKGTMPDNTSITFKDGTLGIAGSAFKGCSGLTSVTIPNSVTSIGDVAFSDCSRLTSVTIGNSVTSIGSSAFYGCRGLTSVTIPNSVISIGDKAFYKCIKLPSVTIPNSVTSIGFMAFCGCSGLTSVTIPNSVTSIGQEAFKNCSGLTSVVFNAENCTSMGSSYYLVFAGCSNLTSLTIGENVKTIPDYAFSKCSGLTSVTIPNSVTSIGNSAFYNCSGLTSVTIGNSITSIGESAFYNCRGLTSVTIPNSVTEIGSSAFQSCSGLISVTIGNSVTSIGSSAFSGCSSLSMLKWNVIAHPDFSSSVFPESPLTYVVIGDEVLSVPNNLCKGITTINQVSIGKKVETIGNNSFAGCAGIKTITWKPINYTGKLPFPSTITPTQFSFGNAVETIPENLCYGYSKITSITLPATVKTIGDLAFFGCNLTEVTCRAALPPTMFETTFSQSAYDNATLYVYANSEDYYRDDEFWQNFYNVQTLSGGTVIEPVQLSVLFPDRGKVKIAVPYNKTVTLTVLPNDIAGFGLSSATFNGVEIIDELDENYQYTTPVLTEDAVLSVVYVNVDGGVDQSLANRIKVSASNGTVRVHGAAPESEVLVCDLSGKIVRKSTEKTFTLGEGIYILNVEGLSFKFAM